MTARTDAPGGPAKPAGRTSREREQRGAGWRWALGVVVALGFHGALLALIRVPVSTTHRVDRLDPRLAWVGDKVLMEEESLRGQAMSLIDDAPLFLVTSMNYAGAQRSISARRRPGEESARDEPVFLVPVDRSPEGLVVPPTDSTTPLMALEGFRWPYFAYFGRGDRTVRPVGTPAALARLEVHEAETGRWLMATAVEPEPGTEGPAPWPDWRSYELMVSIGETGHMSDPVPLARGSGSDVVDRFLRDYVRQRLRLDLRLGPGNYRITVGP